MKLTIIGPDDSKLLESFLNGKPVSFAEYKGYRIFVGDAYENNQKKLEQIAQQLQEQAAENLTLANTIRKTTKTLWHQ